MGKAWVMSKTVLTNLIIIALTGWLAYSLYDADASIKPALILIVVGAVNIYLRVVHTESRVSVLPGPLGRVV